MFRGFGSAVAFCALILPAVAAPALSKQRIIIPGGTAVTVVVASPISSSTAKVGDSIAIQVQSEVDVNGWIAISKGAPGKGTITSVDHAGSHGHPGCLGITMNWIYAVDGEKVRLTSQNVSEEGKSTAGVSNTVTIISWATLGLAGLFAHNFVKGHDVTLDATHPLNAYVDQSVYIVASTRHANASAGFAKPAPPMTRSCPFYELSNVCDGVSPNMRR
jgi:hypothetical protein